MLVSYVNMTVQSMHISEVWFAWTEFEFVDLITKIFHLHWIYEYIYTTIEMFVWHTFSEACCRYSSPGLDKSTDL